jgi:hypothetical protein
MIKLFGASQILKHDETICVYRTGSTWYVDGKPMKDDFIRFEIIGNVQPLNGRQLQMVPEHDRFKEQYWIYANNGQSVKNVGLDIEVERPLLRINDRVLRLNSNFQVQEVENWGTYLRARIMKIDIGVNATP